MKTAFAIALLIAMSYALNEMAPEAHGEVLESTGMDMNMSMMYMTFWTGNNMFFLWKKAESNSTMQFILGLACCLVGAIIFELLQHFRTKLYRGTIYELAQRDSANA